MATKTKPETNEPAPDDTAAAAPRKPGALASWLPVAAVLLLAPLGTWAVVEYVMVPRLVKQLAHVAADPQSVTASAAQPASVPAKPNPGGSYEFDNVVVNLAGTMGTRYLKTSLVVMGSDPGLKAVFEAEKPQVTDVTLNVLSSLTLNDLEQPGSKNVLREKLVNAYNQVLGRKVADQVYFSDFVIQ